jgi:hypothetical protein
MMTLAGLAICIGLFGLFCGTAAEVEPIEVKGSHLFYKNGTAFFVSLSKSMYNKAQGYRFAG